MPTSEPQAVTRDVLRRFVAAPADRRRRRRLPAVVVGAPEVPLPLPGPRPTVLRPTPNTLSVCCVYFSYCRYIVYIAYFELPTVMDTLLPQRLFLHGIDDF